MQFSITVCGENWMQTMLKRLTLNILGFTEELIFDHKYKFHIYNYKNDGCLNLETFVILNNE